MCYWQLRWKFSASILLLKKIKNLHFQIQKKNNQSANHPNATEHMFVVCSSSSVALTDLPTLDALKCFFSSSQWLPHRTGLQPQQERLMTDSCSPSSHGYYCDLTDNTTPSIHCLLKELVQRSAIRRPGVSMAMWPI